MNNVVADKSFEFAVRTVNLCKYLKQEKRNTRFQISYYGVEQALAQIFQKHKEDRVRLILLLK